MGIFKRLHIRMRGTRPVIDHAETKKEHRGPRRDYGKGSTVRVRVEVPLLFASAAVSPWPL
jgi:hypothetical protein